MGVFELEGYTVLQWGRNFIVAETFRRRLAVCRSSSASMGPQLYRCGNRTPCSSILVVLSKCFNGAATLSLRKLNLFFPHLHKFVPLQWGRNFIVAETLYLLSISLPLATLQWGRNFIVAETSNALYYTVCRFQLQWGRNFIVAETPGCHRNRQSRRPRLQWGRNFIVAETRRLSQARAWRARRFNGAATLSLRKPRPVWMPTRRLTALQWSRNFIVAETGPR